MMEEAEKRSRQDAPSVFDPSRPFFFSCGQMIVSQKERPIYRADGGPSEGQDSVSYLLLLNQIFNIFYSYMKNSNSFMSSFLSIFPTREKKKIRGSLKSGRFIIYPGTVNEIQ